MISITFGYDGDGHPRYITAELYGVLDDNDQPTGKVALFAKHAGHVGIGAKIICDTEDERAKLLKLGYQDVTIAKQRKGKRVQQ